METTGDTMKLTRKNLSNGDFWKSKGYSLPSYDIEQVLEYTRKYPSWLHVGAGNIFRAFPAVLQQQLLNKGVVNSGIIVCEVFDEEIIDKAYRAYDNLSIVVTLAGSGEIKKEIIASVVESVKPLTEFDRMNEIFIAPTLQMVSFTITEKGYALCDAQGQIFPWIQEDFDLVEGALPVTTIGLITWLCYKRYQAGELPLALVSMDNCSHNGTLLKEAVLSFADAWIVSGVCEKSFRSYLCDEKRISFNWSMIDKITPRPSDKIITLLSADGLENMHLTQTEKHTFVAPFVNAEQSQYLAIEDTFPNGRPPLEQAGVLFSDRQTIDRIEKMKVCTCLNPLHTVLAVFGCLLGYTSIADEMKNPDLKKFIEQIGYREGMPVVIDPGIINAEEFIRETIEVRFPNPFVPDTPQRIATDTSKKIPIRFGETLKAYSARGEKNLSFLTYIPLFFAGWLRYLMAVDDFGEAFEQSPDPNLDQLKTYFKGILPGDKGPFLTQLRPLLEREDIFGVDLFEYQLGEKVLDMFTQMNAGKHAIERTLAYYLHQED